MEKFKDITPTSKVTGFCKSNVETNQSLFEKGEKVSKETLNELNDSNVVEKWNVINN